MLSLAERKQAKTVFGLIREATSLEVVRDFLRDRKIPTTAPNWDELYTKRILPALEAKTLTLSDLSELLRDVEEYGKQHIFLFKCDPADAMQILKRKRIESIATSAGLMDLMSEPLHLEMPAAPAIVDIRLEEAPNGSGPISLTVKICETRESSKLVDDKLDTATNQRLKVYQITKKRALSIAHLDRDGLLQIRIASRDNSTKYNEQVSAVIAAVLAFIPITSFQPVSLSKVKDTLYYKQDDFVGIIRYTTTTAMNDFGISMNLAASNLSNDLSADHGSSEAMKGFMAKKGFVTGSNIWFILPSDASRQIHVLLNGELNEFAITATCTPGEYSYVIEKILSLN
ncbi:hypothetical protein YA0599_19095 [Pseudomonas syringae]|uniref:hypothetical protein n=1 Tax=Pseudomonas syringae TaxID=317 RepID=UPI0018E5BC48|nr:hypothetical protein [Pseudomonas syringae]MBI6710334.1 hypothetical protein [Pseudomonas syringae]